MVYQYKKAADPSPREELIETHNLDDDEADIILDLLGEVDMGVDDIRNLDAGTSIDIEVGNQEYKIYKDSSDAYDEAVRSVLDTIDDVGLGDPVHWSQFVDDKKAEDFFRQVYSEWDSSYAYDIESEAANDDKYENRLEEEMAEWGADDVDEFAGMMTDSKIDEGEGGLSYYRDNFGDEAADKLIIDENLVDVQAYAKWAVDTDGVAHFLASYDGNMLDLAHGAEAYRTN